MKTIKDYANHAKCLMEVIPCNLSGVIFSFSNWMQFACDMKLTQQERHNHPITRAYLIGLESMLLGSHDYSETLDGLERILNET